ncbi:hypothetical protein MD484_g2884, partial [Candolleomyces efflorescens]
MAAARFTNAFTLFLLALSLTHQSCNGAPTAQYAPVEQRRALSTNNEAREPQGPKPGFRLINPTPDAPDTPTP